MVVDIEAVPEMRSWICAGTIHLFEARGHVVLDVVPHDDLNMLPHVSPHNPQGPLTPTRDTVPNTFAEIRQRMMDVGWAAHDVEGSTLTALDSAQIRGTPGTYHIQQVSAQQYFSNIPGG